MKTTIKVLGCSAILAATAAAHAAGTTLPSTDNSNLLFFVNDSTAHTTYTEVLSQQVNGTSGYFSSANAIAGAGTPSTLNTLFGDANFSDTFSSTSGLGSFISTAKTAGDNLQWGIIAGAYTGATVAAREIEGNSLGVATATSATNVLKVSNTNIAGGMMTGLNTDIKALNLQTFDTGAGTTPNILGTATGIFGTTKSQTTTTLSYYGGGVPMAGLAIGTGTTLYGMTSNGTSSGSAIVYSLGNVSFDGTTLSFTGNVSSVPLPAAAWLLGSGLLGLLGIGRRNTRSTAVAA